MTAVWSQDTDAENCALVQGRLPAACGIGSAGRTVGMPYARNAETDGRTPSLADDGFSITIGGQGVGTQAAPQPDRNADQALDSADIQVKYDGLFAEPRLNVATGDLRSAFRPGETVSFRASSNYPGQIARAEVRITGQSEGFGLPQTTVIPIPANGTAGWAMPADDRDGYTYVLRVYDAGGRFDETAPLPLDRQTNPAMPVLNDPVIAAGEGEDRTARHNIPAGGGVVTVFGAGLPANATVTVMGQAVPVDADGRFVTQRLMPFGTHDVSVDLSAPGARGLVIERKVVIPRRDWFYAGTADFTLSRRGASIGNGVVRTEGQLAFYAKGTIDGRTRITASADTGEGELDRLFDDFFDKSPRSLLDRIDPDDLYPTYGDDSRIVDDAPTSGRIFLKVERGDSHVMWGDFRNEIDGTRFVNTARNLYGAQAVYRSPGSTADGERRARLSFYAASPDSLPQRDELRGTGG